MEGGTVNRSSPRRSGPRRRRPHARASVGIVLIKATTQIAIGKALDRRRKRSRSVAIDDGIMQIFAKVKDVRRGIVPISKGGRQILIASLVVG